MEEPEQSSQPEARRWTSAQTPAAASACRQPSAVSLGLKPTSGRVPRTGHIVPWGLGGMDSLTTIGPMARYVEDLWLGFSTIAGPDGVDPFIHPVPLNDPASIDVA